MHSAYVGPGKDNGRTFGRGGAAHPPGLRSGLGELRGRSPAMQDLYRSIERVADGDTTVLIVGESGTGKELVAQTIHALSARREHAFVPVNCGAIVPTLIEAELFGHEKGSFTGAIDRRAGYFEHGSGGTVFLDEISEMPAPMQVKLLHVLETGRIRRVGGAEEIPVDVRVVAASNRDLNEAVAAGTFREDLMYRLAVFPITVPPLRERGDDVELLARYFVGQLNAREKAHKSLSRHSLDVLRVRPWPGNVRELRNTLQRAFILADRQIDIAPGGAGPSVATRGADGSLSFRPGTSLADAQREIILATLTHFGGDKRRAAGALGISLKTLYNRLGRYGDGHVRRHHRPAAA
jgi:two-component system, NtrC family, response regulator HydG